MAQFQYRAVDPQGKVVEGTIEAAEVPAVVARLHDRGLIPINIASGDGVPARAARVTLPELPALGRKRVKGRDLLVMTQELSALVSAGLPLDRSLATLAELTDNVELKRILTEVLHAVQGGKSLAEALGQHKAFPPLYVNMIRAGEIGGFLETVLVRLAEYLERGQTLRDDVRSALTYPILLTCAMGVSILVLLVYVLPKFSALFTDMGRALPLQAQIILGLSDAIRGYWWAGIGIVGLAVAGFRYSIRTPRGRYGWDQWKLRMALVGPLLRKMEVASLARTLGTLLKSGVPMLQALGIVKEVAGNQVIGRALGDVEVGVREGAGVAEPLARSGVFPPLAVQMIAVGEETGKLDEMLIRVADHFDREVRVRIQQFTRLLEPVLILVMGLGVGFIVISMLSAIFSVNDLPM
ncbi:MAG TPA: type II secretion system F family protein [Gaiellaceae bacterium]|nr:type II secretion system F family protein [Gaiellaceae bacterium]